MSCGVRHGDVLSGGVRVIKCRDSRRAATGKAQAGSGLMGGRKRDGEDA